MTERRDREWPRWTAGTSAAMNTGPYIVSGTTGTTTWTTLLYLCKCGCGHAKRCPSRVAIGETASDEHQQ